MKGRPISRETPFGSLFESDDIYRHTRVVAPRECSRSDVDERLKCGRGVAQMMQFATKIRERLRVARFGPERPRDSLTRERRAPCVEDQEGDEFLLTDTWSATGEAAVREDAKASKQFEA